MISTWRDNGGTTAYYDDDNDTGTTYVTSSYWSETTNTYPEEEEIEIIEKVSFEMIWSIILFYIILKKLVEARVRSPPIRLSRTTSR